MELPRRHDPAAPAGEEAASTFRLAADEPLALGIRRIVIEQVDRGVALVRHQSDIDRTAHDLRRALKRSRAVLRLVRGELGRSRYREENAVLRDTARRWAPLRDSAVMALTAADLVADGDPVGELLGRRLVAALEGRAGAARAAAAADSSLRVDTLTTLLCFRRRVAGHPVVGAGAFPDAFVAVAPGLRRTARQARADMVAAQAYPGAHLLHEWRKSVKYLRHQLEVLQPVWEGMLGALAEGLDDLGEMLGGDHDLAVLGHALATDLDLVPDAALRDRLLAAIEERRRALQTEAFRLGPMLLAAPGALVDQVAAAWSYARNTDS